MEEELNMVELSGGEFDNEIKVQYPSQEDISRLLYAGVTTELDLRGNNTPSPLANDAKYIYYALENFTSIGNVKTNAAAVKILINELVQGENIYMSIVKVELIEQDFFVSW